MNVVLTMIDTAGIQDYIFGSNRLRENIGASYLVEQATSNWVYDELKRLEGHNIKDPKPDEDETDWIDRHKPIEQDDQTFELIFAGGGNAAILFRSLDDAKRFAWNLSRRIFEEAPGLEVVIAHSEPFDWNPDKEDLLPDERLGDHVDKLRDERLAAKKRTRQAMPTPLLGLGVSAECEATGLVATQSSRDLEAEPRMVSREIMAKLRVTQKDKPNGEIRNEAKDRLLKHLRKSDGNFNGDEFEFSDDLDHLGRCGGEESYIGVVHIDGNSMGEMIKDYVGEAKTNRAYIERLRNFSKGIELASGAALVRTLGVLRSHIKSDRDLKTGRPIHVVTEATPKSVPEDRRTKSQQKRFRLFPQEKDEGPNEKPCWPFRPLVFGGDDVTFVCIGQLGLSLATIYMNAFTAETRKRIKDFQGREIHTGAGVCIVKAHYPFRRAYELSEALTKEAKRHLQEERPRASAIDWHISSTGLSGSLKAIRTREYSAHEGSLQMRPTRLKHDSDWRTWQNFNQLVGDFNFDEQWAGHRNKVKSLRDALRGGKEAVQEFLKINDVELPVLTNAPANLHEQGWEGNHCAYFDAIEAMDHHFLLKEANDGDND